MIPEAAVEAAAHGLAVQAWGEWEYVPDALRRLFLRDAQLALEAAASHMLAEAWDEGRVVGMMDPHRIEQSIKLNAPDYAEVANPYR